MKIVKLEVKVEPMDAIWREATMHVDTSSWLRLCQWITYPIGWFVTHQVLSHRRRALHR